MKKGFFMILFFFIYACGFAQITETEPNNSCSEGIENNTITENNVYTGTVNSDTDLYDFWFIQAGSSGEATFTVAADFSARFILYEGDPDYCTASDVLTIDSGNSNSYTLNSTKYYSFKLQVFGGGPPSGTYTVTISGDAALPVELTLFTAEMSGESVIIKWETASETNLLGFGIDSRTTSTDVWQKLADYHTATELKNKGSATYGASYQYTHELTDKNQDYEYRLSETTISGVQNILGTVTVSQANPDTHVPDKVSMMPVYPNPFNPTTRITWQLNQESMVNLSIIDITGRVVAEPLTRTTQQAGVYHTTWQGLDQYGHNAASGVYLFVLQVDQALYVQKALLLR